MAKARVVFTKDNEYYTPRKVVKSERKDLEEELKALTIKRNKEQNNKKCSHLSRRIVDIKDLLYEIEKEGVKKPLQDFTEEDINKTSHLIINEIYYFMNRRYNNLEEEEQIEIYKIIIKWIRRLKANGKEE